MSNFGYTTYRNASSLYLFYKYKEESKIKRLPEDFWDLGVGAIDAPEFIPHGSVTDEGFSLHREHHVPYTGTSYPPRGWDRLFYSKTSMEIFFLMNDIKSLRERYYFVRKFLLYEQRYF